MITRIKIDFGDLAAKVLQLSRGCGTPLAGPGGQHDTKSGPRITAGDRESDVGGAAEQ